MGTNGGIMREGVRTVRDVTKVKMLLRRTYRHHSSQGSFDVHIRTRSKYK